MCDCLVALPSATAHGATLFAKNSDRPTHERQDLVWLPPRTDHGPTMCTHIGISPHRKPTMGVLASQPTWMWGVEMGVNEAKVAIGNERIFTTVDPRAYPPALTGMDLVRLGLERADTAESAVAVMVDLLERYGQGGTGLDISHSPYWSSFLIADPEQAWVLETSAASWASERVDTTRAISNRTTIATFDALHRHPRQPVEFTADPRLHASQMALRQTPLKAGHLLEHSRSHAGSGGYTICMHIDETNEPDPRHHQVTTAAMVAEVPRNGEATVWFAPGSPCRTAFQHHRIGPVQAVQPPSTMNSEPVE